MLLFHDRLVTQAEAVRHGAKRVCRLAGEQQNANEWYHQRGDATRAAEQSRAFNKREAEGGL